MPSDMNQAYKNRIQQKTLIHGRWLSEESWTLYSISLLINHENSRKTLHVAFKIKFFENPPKGEPGSKRKERNFIYLKHRKPTNVDEHMELT